jgi:hypothetical protein
MRDIKDALIICGLLFALLVIGNLAGISLS